MCRWTRRAQVRGLGDEEAAGSSAEKPWHRGRGVVHSDDMHTWHVTAAPVPESLDAPEAWALHGAAEVSRATELERWGTDDLAYTARYMLARLNERTYATRIRLVATDTDPGTGTLPAGSVIGTAYLIMPTRSNAHLCHLELTVHPRHQGLGVGTALLQEVERLAVTHGRTTIIVATDHRGEPPLGVPGVLEPPTGSGRIASTDRAAAFTRRRGYVLEQAERYSVLHLPVPPAHLAVLRADAFARAGDDYRLVHWTGGAPREWLDDVARLNTRMSTDAPLGGLEIEEDPWDAERVRRAEHDVAAAMHGHLTVAVEHVPSGELAAFTRVEYPLDQAEVVFQEDTLVLREHRGRRLGMLVKATMLERLAEVRPGARRVHTWNAEENAYMLAINVALGFRPTGVGGLWQKHVAAPGAEAAGRQLSASEV